MRLIDAAGCRRSRWSVLAALSVVFWLVATVAPAAGAVPSAPADPSSSGSPKSASDPKPSADLAVTLSSGASAPGKRVSYVIKITNHGPASASGVRANFTTSRSLASVRSTDSGGHCVRGTRKTTCTFGTLRPGGTATATISGVLSKKLKKGDAVANTVTLASGTHLVNTANDTARDDYRIGIPKATAPPSPQPSPSPTHESNLDKISNTATSAINFTNSALVWSIVALGAAALWFAIGLSMRAYKRHRDPGAYLDS